MSLRISRVLHAGYLLEAEGTQICFDPIFENPFSRNCYAFPSVQFDTEKIRELKLSAVFISHFHDDHCSLESLILLDRSTPIYIYCLFEELFSMIKEIGFLFVYSLEINTPIHIGAFEIIPRKALDEDVDSIFHIKSAGLNILNVVDSWIDPSTLAELSKEAPWDMVLWPFQTMREIEVLAPRWSQAAPCTLPSEWLIQLKILNPRYIVPSSCQFIQESWSWYNQAFFPISYLQFQDEIESALPDSQVIRMNPSVSVILSKTTLDFAPSLEWVLPIGNQDVDYQYQEKIQPTKTCEISKHFTPLNLEETEKVFDYCRSGLLKKYNSMEAPSDPYFDQLRFWRLSIFDHQGEATHFDYQLIKNHLTIALHPPKTLSWTTEIPISKFYAALELGESLTSMYLRINDQVFDPKIEKELASVDIVEDPLIRCLFTGAFGAYQLAQLKCIKRLTVSLV